MIYLLDLLLIPQVLHLHLLLLQVLLIQVKITIIFIKRILLLWSISFSLVPWILMLVCKVQVLIINPILLISLKRIIKTVDLKVTKTINAIKVVYLNNNSFDILSRCAKRIFRMNSFGNYLRHKIIGII